MENIKQEINLPKHGYINKLADVCKCSRHTVRRALFDNATGKKAEIVRKTFKLLYK